MVRDENPNPQTQRGGMGLQFEQGSVCCVHEATVNPTDTNAEFLFTVKQQRILCMSVTRSSKFWGSPHTQLFLYLVS